MLASNIKEEAAHLPEIEVPKEMISDIDVTEDAAVLDEFEVVTLDENDEPVPVGVEASDFETSHKEHDYATDDEDGGSN